MDELLAARRALAAVDPHDRCAAYYALRPVLCSGHEQLAAFDAAFGEWFGSAPPAQTAATAPAAWPEVEVPCDKDFADYTDAERHAARAVMRRLAARGPVRSSRRHLPARRRGTRPAGGWPGLQHALRASLRLDGEPFERHWREPRERPRPIVLVCDVSGSMEPYARMLLRYLQACAATRGRVEAFVFGAGLTRVTPGLRDPDRTLELATRASADWPGGTHVGEALAALDREHGHVGRGAVVVLLSDGWDRGDPVQLHSEVARLARRAHRLIWLNPLKAHPDHEPLTRGMQAALPHVDHFQAGNSLRALEELARLLEGAFE